jgi:hypothetical protein
VATSNYYSLFKYVQFMKKTLLCALSVALVILGCQENETIKPVKEQEQSNQFPVSEGLTEKLTDEQRQRSSARIATTYVPEELYINNGYEMKAIDYNTGTGYTYYHDNSPFVAMASTNGFIFGIAYGELWRSDPTTNASYTPFGPYGTGWGGTEAMTALGSYVYAIQGGTLWRVSASNGAVAAFGDYSDGWAGTEAMTAIGSYIYAVQGGTLWRVNTSSGAVSTFSNYPNNWAGTVAMAATGSYVYAVQGGVLWRTNTSSGAISTLGTGSWPSTAAMTAKDGYVFIVDSGLLWKVNTTTGAISQLGSLSWPYTMSMTARM